MPATDPNPRGIPCWVDLFSSDVDAARAFYAGLLGWDSDVSGEEFGGYVNFHSGGVPVAGCMGNDGSPGTPDAWTVYLGVADIDATAAAATSHGGQVMLASTDVGDLGKMAILSDAGGAAVGLWQPGLHRGFGTIGEPGAPAWFELNARAYDESLAFYASVFGWGFETVSDTPEFRYSSAGEGDAAFAGVMDADQMLPPGVPPHWSVYFAVPDTDAAARRAVELAGSVVVTAEDSPYGRLATLADPTGARFKIVQLPQ